MKDFFFKKNAHIGIILIILGFALRFNQFHAPGTTDIKYFEGWLRASNEKPIDKLYEDRSWAHEDPEYLRYRLPISYPPGTIGILWISNKIISKISPEFLEPGKSIVIIKSLLVIFDIIFLISIYFLSKIIYLKSTKLHPLFTTGICSLSPAVILGGTTLGYIDMFSVAPLTLGLLLLQKKYPVLSWLLIWSALLIKQVVLFAIPIALIAFWQSRSSFKTILIPILTGFVVSLLFFVPFISNGIFIEVLIFLKKISIHNNLAPNGMSLWGLIKSINITYNLNYLPTIENARLVGIIFITILITWLCIKYYRYPSFESLILNIVISLFTYVTFATGVHENHLLYPAYFALLLPLRKYWLFILALQVAAFANLFIYYGDTLNFSGMNSNNTTLLFFNFFAFLVFLWSLYIANDRFKTTHN